MTAWRGTAEFITRYFRKASSICVVGSIQTRSWVDQQGQKRFATEVVADEAYFVDAKSEAPQAVQNMGQTAQGYGSPAAVPEQSYMPDGYGVQSPMAQAAPAFENIADDDELPF